MVEIEEDDVQTSEAILSLVQEAGLILGERRQSPMFKESKYASIFNYFFVRKQN
jgi:hypothetical protein